MDLSRWSPSSVRLLRECWHAERLRCIRRGLDLPTQERVMVEALRAMRHHQTHELRVLGYTWDDVAREIELYRSKAAERGEATADREQVIDDE